MKTKSINLYSLLMILCLCFTNSWAMDEANKDTPPSAIMMGHPFPAPSKLPKTSNPPSLQPFNSEIQDLLKTTEEGFQKFKDKPSPSADGNSSCN